MVGMARIALLPDITLPHSLDDVRDRLVADASIDDCAVLTATAHTVDSAILNPELADALQSIESIDLVVAVGHTADAAVASHGEAGVILIDPPLGGIVFRHRPLGSPSSPLPLSPDAEENLATMLGEASDEATRHADPLELRLLDETTDFIRSRMPLEAAHPEPIPTLQWVLDARDRADYLDIWVTRTAIERLELGAQNALDDPNPTDWPDDWPPRPPDLVSFAEFLNEQPPLWDRTLDWDPYWWWSAPQTAADAILRVLDRR